MTGIKLMHGDCLDVLRGMADNSVDSIVTDPPYGLSFMGKKWDYDVPSVEIWAECLRVLKPGGHLLAFAGTRTQHRMAVRIEDAGFEIRDMIAWVYGCLSEDSEVLTEDGWMPYNRATQKNILAYDLQNDIYQWERPSRWNEYRVESDTAYRIQSGHTDQIVSRGHRCIVERGGMLAFVPADELAGVERVPYLRGDFSALPQGRGELLLKAVLREGEGLAQAALSERQGQEVPSEGIAKGEKPSVEGRSDLLQAQGQVRGSVNQVRALPRKHDEHGAQGRVCDGASPCCGAGDWQTADAGGMRAPRQPRCDGQPIGEPDAVCDQCGSQEVRARPSYQTTVATVTAIEYSGLIWCPTVSTGAFVARRNGKVFITGNSGFPKSLDVSKAIDKHGPSGQVPFAEFAAHYEARRKASGLTHAQVCAAGGWHGATNHGGTSANWANGYGLPTAEQWAVLRPLLGLGDEWAVHVEREQYEREVVGKRAVNRGVAFFRYGPDEIPITAPGSDAARQWQGWGTALKPALEPITVARKPLVGTVAANVLAHGTGALNIDGCRVESEVARPLREARRNVASDDARNAYSQGLAGSMAVGETTLGRWPANLIHDGSDDVRAGFPLTSSGVKAGGQYARESGVHAGGQRVDGAACYGDTGSAARFFYCAKASKKDRDEGLEHIEAVHRPNGNKWTDQDYRVTNGERSDGREAGPRKNIHPTVKPTDLMAYLCRLVTPPGGIVLDPFMGSGSTGKAARLEGFGFIGIEREAAYIDIARARIDAATAQAGLFAEVANV